MNDKLQFNLVSPEGEIFSGAVDAVRVPGSEGEFGARARHAPFMALIKTANDKGEAMVVEAVNDGTASRYEIEGGFVELTPAGLTILAETIKQI